MHILQPHILGWLCELCVICVLMHACVKSLSNVLPFKFLECYIHLFECKHRHVGANVRPCNHRGLDLWMWPQGQKKSNQQYHSVFVQSINLSNFFLKQLLSLNRILPKLSRNLILLDPGCHGNSSGYSGEAGLGIQTSDLPVTNGWSLGYYFHGHISKQQFVNVSNTLFC